MIKNYFKTALRNIIRQKGFSLINIAGLAIGMACFILMMLYVKYELSFDKFHERYEQLYRVIRHYKGVNNSKDRYISGTPAPLAPTMVKEFPEVINGTRIGDIKGTFHYKNKKFTEDGLFADNHFFELFSFELLEGNRKTVLAEPFSVVVSEKLAKKYFGEKNPMGQTINFSKQVNERNSGDTIDQYDLKVTGVIKEVPGNSHFHFDYLISFLTLAATKGNEGRLGMWGRSQFYNYIELQKGTSYRELNKKLSPFTEKYRKNNVEKYVLQSLKDIHLKSLVGFEMPLTNISNIKYIYIFSSIAFIILILACINYMNLATARFTKRIKEIGVRKVVGANRSQLIKQFMSESFLLSILGLTLALVSVILILPSFNSFVERSLQFNFLKNPVILFILTGMVLFTGIFSGSYPALFLSSLNPLKILKGKVKDSKGSIFRNVLVFLQFTISIALIACTIAAFNQLNFIRNTDVGYEKEHVVVIPLRDNEARKKEGVITSELLGNSKVQGVAGSEYIPLSINNYFSIVSTRGNGEVFQEEAFDCGIGYFFLDVFKIKLAAGRNFSREFATDEKKAVILNEAAVKKTGWTNPIGKAILDQRLGSSKNRCVVIGVVKDFHHDSLHDKIRPMVLTLVPDNHAFLSVRIKPGSIPETIEFLKKTVEKHSPDFAFEYYFQDEYFNNKYKADQRFGAIFTYFSFLAIFIACLGLFGLASFSAEQRTKEIGVRKVLGATVSNITLLLAKEFLKWVLLANIIAWPISYFTVNKWLQNFAYRVDIDIRTFLISGLLALGIAFLSVSYKSIKTAKTNPVNTLRYE